MIRKLLLVLSCYTSNPWTIAGISLYLFIAGVAFAVSLAPPRDLQVTSFFDRYTSVTASIDTPNNLAHWNNDERKLSNLKGVSLGKRTYSTPLKNDAFENSMLRKTQRSYRELDSATLKVLQQLTNLRSLEMNGFSTQPELYRMLSSLSELRDLRIDIEGKVDLKELPNLPKLELLSLGVTDASQLGILRKFPSLRSLEIEDPGFANTNGAAKVDHRGSTLNELTQLRELIINPNRSMGEMSEDSEAAIQSSLSLDSLPISDSLKREIEQLPNLRFLSLGERGGGYSLKRSGVIRIQDESGLVRSIMVNRSVPNLGSFVFLFEWMLTFLLLVILRNHLVHQFSSSASLLVPNYTLPHGMLPVILSAGHIGLLSYLRMSLDSSSMFPSIAVSIFLLSLFGLLSVLSRLPWVLPIAMLAPYSLLLIQILPIMQWNSFLFWRFFLIGEHPLFTAAILMLELSCVALLVVSLVGRPRSLAGLNLIDAPNLGWFIHAPSEPTGGVATELRYAATDSRLVKLTKKGKKSMLSLWLDGMRPRPGYRFSAVGLISSIPLILLFANLLTDGFKNIAGMFSYGPTILIVLGFLVSLKESAWYASESLERLPYAAQEALLPLTKSSMRNFRMFGMWSHNWPWLLVSLASIGIASLLALFAPTYLSFPIARLWLVYFHSLLSIVGIWGLSLFLLVSKSGFAKRMIAYPLLFAWIGLTIGAVVGWSSGVFDLSLLDLAAVLFPGAAGLILAAIAWYRLPNVEWASGGEF